MEEHSARKSDIVANLLVLYLLERVCVGFLAWANDIGSAFDEDLKVFLVKELAALKQNRLQRERRNLLVDGIDPFNSGATLSLLTEYLKSRSKPDELIFDGKISPYRLFNRLDELKLLRNKFMHGLAYRPDTAATAAKVFAVFQDLRAALGPRLLAIKKLKKPNRSDLRDHTSWARLLYLSKAELLWIVMGNQLPEQAGAARTCCSAPLRCDGVWQDFGLTLTDYRPGSILSTTASQIWVSDDQFEDGWLKSHIPETQRKLRMRLGLPADVLQVHALPIGPTDRDCDWFGAPWWQVAPAGKAHLWVEILDEADSAK